MEKNQKFKAGRPCPACASESSVVDDSLGIWGWEDWRAGYRQCSQCGTSFADSIFSPEQIGAWYSRQFSYPQYESPLKQLDARTRVSFIREKNWLPKPNESVIDVGCAAGLFLTSLKQAAPNSRYTGAELLPQVAAEYSGKRGISIVTLKEIEDHSVDMAFMWHVLEHGPEPQELLSQVLRVCRPGARLLIAVPNRHARGFDERGSQWVWCQAPWVHCVHFTSAGLSAILSRNSITNGAFHYRETVDSFHLAFLNMPDWIPTREGLLRFSELRSEGGEKDLGSFLHSWKLWGNADYLRRARLGRWLSELITSDRQRSELLCMTRLP